MRQFGIYIQYNSEKHHLTEAVMEFTSFIIPKEGKGKEEIRELQDDK